MLPNKCKILGTIFLGLIVLAGNLLIHVADQAAAKAQDAPKKATLQSAEAAKWLAAAEDRFLCTLQIMYQSEPLVFTRNKKNFPANAKGKVFEISAAEAAGIVQAVVDCGLWNRKDTPPPGLLGPGRYLFIGPADPKGGGSWMWGLGDNADDLSSMFLMQHFLKAFQGEPQKAVRDWLVPLAKPKPIAEPPKIEKPHVLPNPAKKQSLAQPADPFTMKGVIKSIGLKGRRGLLVEGLVNGQMDKIIFHLTNETQIIHANKKPAAVSALKIGQPVTIYFAGEFADTDPPQTSAKKIVIEAAGQ